MAKTKLKKTTEVSHEATPASKGIHALLIGLLCIIAFITPLIAGKLTPIPELTVQGLILIAAILWMAAGLKAGSLRIPGGWVLPAAAVLLVLIALSMMDSVFLHGSIREMVNILSYLLIFFMVASLRENRKAVYAMVASLALSAMVVGALGLKEYMLTRDPSWRVFGTFFNPDFLAGFMALMLPIALAWYLSRVSFGVAAISAVTAILIFGALLLTGSRVGLGAASGGFLVFILLGLVSRSIGKQQAVKLAILIIPAFLIFLTLGKPATNRMSTSSMKAESHSGGFRILTWKGTARMAAANPMLGTGIGTFESIYPRFAFVGYTKLAHNSYIQIAAEAGIPAAIALLVLLGSTTIPSTIGLIGKRRESDEWAEPGGFVWMPEPRLLACGLLGGASASMARNLGDSDWYVTALGVSFWIAMGAMVALAHPATQKPVAMKYIHFAVSVAVTSLALCAVVSMLTGQAYLSAAESHMRQLNLDSAMDSYRQSARFDFLNPEPHRKLGSIYKLLIRDMEDKAMQNKTEKEYKAAIRLQPTSARNYYLLAKFYEHKGVITEATETYETALFNDPNSPEILYGFAMYLNWKGQDYERAIQIFRRMVDVEESPYGQVQAIPELVEPKYIFAHRHIGEYYYFNGDYSQAIDEYRKTLKRIERYQSSMKSMGEILEAAGRRDVEIEEAVEENRTEIIERLAKLK